MQLAVDVQGVAFPDLAQSYGWQALGVRHGRVGGRDVTAVYYGKGDRRIGYVIAAGPGLPPPPPRKRRRSAVSRMRRCG